MADDFRDTVVKEFLEGKPRADEWRSLRETLQERLKAARGERDAMGADDPRRVAHQRRVHELREQVAALAQEEAITQFVEESVRASLSRARPYSPDEEDEDSY